MEITKVEQNIITLLQDKNIKFNIPDVNGTTALLYAATEGHLEMTELLLKSGENVNQTNRPGQSALILAAERGYLEITKTLLKYNADVSITDCSNWNALLKARERGYPEIAELLEKAGATTKTKRLTIKDLETRYRLKLPADYKTFFKNKKYDVYDGYRPKEIPGWAESMCYPLCFEPGLVSDIVKNNGIWSWKDDEYKSMYPLACFYTANNIEQLHDMDEFIALKRINAQKSEVYLWDHESGFEKLAPSLESFLKSLISLKSKKWKMGK